MIRRTTNGVRGIFWAGIFGCLLTILGGAWAKDVRFGGQVRPRFEFRDPVAQGHDTFVSMRVRAQIEALLDRDVGVLIQFEDVRLWGEETSTLGDFSADNFDLHQGYMDFKKNEGFRVSTRVGRQEISFGGQRLIGAVGWAQQGRAFDGIRLTAWPEGGKVDLLAIRLGDSTAPASSENAYLTGVYYVVSRFEDTTIDLYSFYNRVSGMSGTDQITLGLRMVGKGGNIPYRVEGSYQFGDRSGEDVSAFMFGARAGLPVGGGKGIVTFWYDYLSGDDEPGDGKANVFDTLFGTNHKYYGFADLFRNIPVHTGGVGAAGRRNQNADVAPKGCIPRRGHSQLLGRDERWIVIQPSLRGA